MRHVSFTQNILDPTQFLQDMADPVFAADWWARFERGFRQLLAVKAERVVWVTGWEWSVEPVSVPSDPARQIVGSCWARPAGHQGVACTCPRGCVDGDVYTYCGSALCDGFCEYTGRCPCQASEHKPGRHDLWNE
jgi:hypothetical protein